MTAHTSTHVDLTHHDKHSVDYCSAKISRLDAVMEAQRARLDKSEQILNERIEEIHTIQSNIILSAHKLEGMKTEIDRLRKEIHDVRREHVDMNRELKNAMTLYYIARWFLGAVIPMLIGIFLMNVFRLDSFPFGG